MKKGKICQIVVQIAILCRISEVAMLRSSRPLWRPLVEDLSGKDTDEVFDNLVDRMEKLRIKK